MEQVKKAHKKVGTLKLITQWMKIQEDLVEDACFSLLRMRVAFWAMFIFQVVFTLAFLLVLYGNQYLVR